MRPLHRPMFRYGGPIKEGVMSGIREPHANGGRIALVGSPIFPKDASGRAHHKDYWKNLWAAGKPILKSWVTPWKKPKKVVQAGEKIVGNKNLQGIFDMTSKKATGITSSPAAQNVWKNLKSFSFPGASRLKGWATKGKDLAIKYPKSTIVGGAYVGPKIIANVPTPKWSGSWGIKDILVPDEIYNYETGRWFNPDDKDIKPEDRVVTGVNRPGDDGTGDLGDPPVVIPQKSADEIRAERIQKYRDIMDIKGMNKRAAYDSLIDASKLVQESGDLKEDIKSGNLINQIIQATSKRFDKPAKTKDAIDTLILKGEIEKDIKSTMPTEAEKTAAAFGISKDEYKKKLLGKDSAAQIIASISTKTGRVDSTTVASGYKASGFVPKATITDTIIDEWIDDNSGKTEIDYVKEVVSKADGFGPGLYVVGDRAILFDGTNYSYDY